MGLNIRHEISTSVCTVLVDESKTKTSGCTRNHKIVPAFNRFKVFHSPNCAINYDQMPVSKDENKDKNCIVAVSIDDYIRTMRTGYTVPADAEYSLLRKAMALYAEYGYKSDDETINKIALAIGRKPKTAQKMIVGGMRNMMFTDFYRRCADEDSEESAEDVTVDTTTEPSRMFYHERRLKILCEAFDNLEYRERAIIAEHLGFCENCWSTRYIAEENGEKVKRKFKGKAFIDLAGEHGIVPSSADQIYRGAIDKLRKALEEDKWL